jgi:type II secretion system protein C
MSRHRLTSLLTLAALASPFAIAQEPTKTDGSDLGITIMGSIVQKLSEDNVALIKEGSGTVKAVKKDHVISDKYKVVAVHPQYIEIVTRDAKRYIVYQDKFAGNFTPNKSEAGPGPSLAGAAAEYFKEDGFERAKDKITMTGMYRDKLVKEDMAKVLMQATAEPYMENGQIIGFKISQIDEGSIYSKAGLQNNDIVTNINGQDLNSIAASIKLLQSLKGSDHVEVVVRRDGSPVNFSISVK